jgi:hypothetical protein
MWTRISTANFSNDGERLFVKLSSSVSSLSISCSKLFKNGIFSASTCSVTDEGLVTVFPVPKTVYLGTQRSLRLDTPLNCLPNPCIIDTTSVVVSQPQTLKLPVIQLVGPSLVTTCFDVDIDWSSSTGHGNRPWHRFEVIVSGTSSNISNHVSIERILKHSLTSSVTRSIISRELLVVSESYNIVLKLCNFLDACNSAELAFTVVENDQSDALPPFINIQGSRIRNAIKQESILVTAESYNQLCGGRRNTKGRKYQWFLWNRKTQQ